MRKTTSSYVLSYGCMTAAGQGASALYAGLTAGRVYRSGVVVPGMALVSMVRDLEAAWQEAFNRLAVDEIETVVGDLGVIFASTKGGIEDIVWAPELPNDSDGDTLEPVLSQFLKRAALHPRRAVCVSNACSSTHVALELASRWLARGLVSYVIVVAADQFGRFVEQGFAALKSLTPGEVTPFGANRQGIRIGTAAAALLLGSKPLRSIPDAPRLAGIATCAEGHAVTRSEASGLSLATCCAVALAGERPPDLVIAHGTGTEANDALEDAVLSRIVGRGVGVTGSKWSIGHTLGASGAVDVIAACETLRQQRAFALATTHEIDPSFRCSYVTSAVRASSDGPIDRVLVTSVGFGGMHGAALVERAL